MRKFRSSLYQLARLIGDVDAILSGRIVKRGVNKFVGRKFVSKVWWH